MSSADDLVTTTEAAKILGRTRATVDYMRRQGALAPVSVRPYKFRQIDLTNIKGARTAGKKEKYSRAQVKLLEDQVAELEATIQGFMAFTHPNRSFELNDANKLKTLWSKAQVLAAKTTWDRAEVREFVDRCLPLAGTDLLRLDDVVKQPRAWKVLYSLLRQAQAATALHEDYLKSLHLRLLGRKIQAAVLRMEQNLNIVAFTQDREGYQRLIKGRQNVEPAAPRRKNVRIK